MKKTKEDLKKPKTITERQNSYRNRQLVLGRKSKVIWLTDAENKQVKTLIKELRTEDDADTDI